MARAVARLRRLERRRRAGQPEHHQLGLGGQQHATHRLGQQQDLARPRFEGEPPLGPHRQPLHLLEGCRPRGLSVGQPLGPALGLHPEVGEARPILLRQPRRLGHQTRLFGPVGEGGGEGAERLLLFGHMFGDVVDVLRVAEGEVAEGRHAHVGHAAHHEVEGDVALARGADRGHVALDPLHGQPGDAGQRQDHDDHRGEAARDALENAETGKHGRAPGRGAWGARVALQAIAGAGFRSLKARPTTTRPARLRPRFRGPTRDPAPPRSSRPLRPPRQPLV